MDRDVAPLLAPVPGIDLERYKDSWSSAANRAIADQLERVCLDGSSKFPQVHRPHRQSADRRRPAAGTVPWWWRPGRCTWAGSTSMANATRFPIRAPPNARRWLPNATAWAGACSAWRPCSARRSRPRRLVEAFERLYDVCADTASAKPCARYSANDSGGPHARLFLGIDCGTKAARRCCSTPAAAARLGSAARSARRKAATDAASRTRRTG